MHEKINFIFVENNTLVFLATVLIVCRNYDMDYEFIFPKIILLTMIFFVCIGLFYFTSQRILNFKVTPLYFIISLVFSIIIIVMIKLSGKWDKIILNADIHFNIVGIMCACTYLASLFC